MKAEDLTITFLKENYLFGINLADIYGNEMKDSMLQHYIDSAIEYTQRVFQICIRPIEVTQEMHDYYAGDYTNWSFIQLHKRPVIEVTSLSMNYNMSQMFKIPNDWVTLYSIPGQVQLFPTSGSSGSMILTQGGSFLPLTIGAWSNAPGIWRVDYRAGFEELPQDLVEYIMKRASIGILQVWGDLIIGAGIANQTISLDGLSQSIGTTQSPEFSGAGSRIKMYQEDMKDLEKRLKDTYVGINLGVL